MDPWCCLPEGQRHGQGQTRHLEEGDSHLWGAVLTNKGTFAGTAVELNGQLHGVEREVKDLPAEDQLRERQTRAAPVDQALRKWLLLDIAVDRRIAGEFVVRVLDQMARFRGYQPSIQLVSRNVALATC